VSIINIIFIGPQGSGKGTQAQLTSKEYNIPHISTGDMFREIREENSSLGREVKELIDNGNMVSDELADQVVRKRIAKDDCKQGFILDGFPRDLAQAKYMEKLAKIKYVVDINISDKESVKRLSARLTCKKQGHVFNRITHPPKKEGICDICGGELIQRDDDLRSAIEQRLKTYHKKTQPLINFYKKEGLLIEINGQQDIDKVFKDIKEKIGNN